MEIILSCFYFSKLTYNDFQQIFLKFSLYINENPEQYTFDLEKQAHFPPFFIYKMCILISRSQYL